MDVDADDHPGDRRMPQDVWHILELAAIHSPEKLAVVDCGKDFLLTYSDLHLRASMLAAWMKRQGVRRGDRIGVMCRNSSHVMEMHFAAAALHAVVVNINIHLAPVELEYIFQDSKPVLTFVDKGASRNFVAAARSDRCHAGTLVLVDVTENDYLDTEIGLNAIDYGDIFSENISNPHRVDICCESLSEGSEEDGFHMYYTSGTTGKPKGVLLSHNIVVRHAVGTIKGNE